MSKDQRATTYNKIGLKNCRVRASTEVTRTTDITYHSTCNYSVMDFLSSRGLSTLCPNL